MLNSLQTARSWPAIRWVFTHYGLMLPCHCRLHCAAAHPNRRMACLQDTGHAAQEVHPGSPSETQNASDRGSALCKMSGTCGCPQALVQGPILPSPTAAQHCLCACANPGRTPGCASLCTAPSEHQRWSQCSPAPPLHAIASVHAQILLAPLAAQTSGLLNITDALSLASLNLAISSPSLPSLAGPVRPWSRACWESSRSPRRSLAEARGLTKGLGAYEDSMPLLLLWWRPVRASSLQRSAGWEAVDVPACCCSCS